MYNVLVINPGSTSTKISVFHGNEEIINKNVEHEWEELMKYDLFDQAPFRKEAIIDFLKENNYDINNIDAVVSRGTNLVKPVVCGIYEISEEVLQDAVAGTRNHISSIGPFIADNIAKSIGVKSYIVHPNNIDEHFNLATFSGLNGFKRDSKFHVESHKAIGKAAADKLGKKYEEVNLIVAHMGGGISICAHHKGRCIDSLPANKGNGPFSGRRAGGLSPWNMLDICFSEGMNRAKVEEILMKKGGLVSYLGTDDCIEIEKRISEGDEYAAVVYEAMAYNISKGISYLTPALKGNVDSICLTGGMANSSMLCKWIEERTSFISSVMIFPGSRIEQISINEYMQEVLHGITEAKVY